MTNHRRPPNHNSRAMYIGRFRVLSSLKLYRQIVRSLRSDALLYVCNSIIAHIPSHTLRTLFYVRIMNVEVGQGSSIHLRLRLYTRGQITVGDHTIIDRDCVLDGRGHISIGSNVNLAPEVMVLTASHDPDDPGFGEIVQPVVIEDYAWIATRATILPGVHVGHGSIVGAGAVVTRDVAPDSIVAGNPARQIRERQGPQTYILRYKRRFH